MLAVPAEVSKVPSRSIQKLKYMRQEVYKQLEVSKVPSRSIQKLKYIRQEVQATMFEFIQIPNGSILKFWVCIFPESLDNSKALYRSNNKFNKTGSRRLNRLKKAEREITFALGVHIIEKQNKIIESFLKELLLMKSYSYLRANFVVTHPTTMRHVLPLIRKDYPKRN